MFILACFVFAFLFGILGLCYLILTTRPLPIFISLYVAVAVVVALVDFFWGVLGVRIPLIIIFFMFCLCTLLAWVEAEQVNRPMRFIWAAGLATYCTLCFGPMVILIEALANA